MPGRSPSSPSSQSLHTNYRSRESRSKTKGNKRETTLITKLTVYCMNKSQTANQELTFQKIRRDQKEMPALLELWAFFNNNLRRKKVVFLLFCLLLFQLRVWIFWDIKRYKNIFGYFSFCSYDWVSINTELVCFLQGIHRTVFG